MGICIVRYSHNGLSSCSHFAVFDCVDCATDFQQHVDASGGCSLLDVLSEFPSWGDFDEEE